jgi:hypothetical protein
MWYHEPIAQFPYVKKLLGRWLGVAECSIDIMAYYILTATGKVIIRKSIWALSKDKMTSLELQFTDGGSRHCNFP